MASFSSIVSGARSAAMGPVLQQKQNMFGAVGNAEAALKSRVNAGISSASSAAMNGLFNAASSAISGDFAGAGNILGNLGSTVLGAALNSGKAQAGNALQGINAREDSILNFNWFCSPPQLPGVSLPWYYVEAGQLPFRNIDTQEVYRRGHHEKVPKTYSVPNLTLTFFMDNTMKSMQYLKAWQGLVLGNSAARTKSNQGKWGRPNMAGNRGFYKTIPIHILSVNKMEVLTIAYIDAWPVNLSTLQLVSDASGRLVAEVEFSVNDVDFVVTPARTLGDQLFDAVLDKVGGFAMKSLSSLGSSLNLPDSVTSFFH